MAKKTKKNTVVKKAVKAAKPAKKSKPAPAKAKAKAKASKPANPVKTASKKSSKPVAKKTVKPASKASKSAAKKSPAKGTRPVAKAAVKNNKINSKAGAKAVKKASPSKPSRPSKPAKAVKPAKAARPVKPVSKAAAPAKKTVKKAAPAVSKPKAEEPKKAAVAKAGVMPEVAKAAPPKGSAKKSAPPVKPGKAKPSKKIQDEEEEIAIDEVPELADAPDADAEADLEAEPIVVVPPTNGKPAKEKRRNGKSKAPTGPRVITAPITPPKPQVMPADKKKEPKGKFEMEYVVHASAYLLFEFLTTPSGLSEWFADDVNIRQGIYTFFWDGSEQQAKLIGYKEGKMARFQWLDKNDGSYFEFRLEIDDLTGDVSLIITDFAEDAAETATTKLLWDSQVNKLLHVIGAYY